MLSCKLCVLFLLVSAQRGQTIHLLRVENVQFYAENVVVMTSQLLKQSRPGYHLTPIELKPFGQNPKLCTVKTFQEYLEHTKNLRMSNELLISTIKPHKGVSRDTVTPWAKILLGKAKVEARFSAHSTRAAAVSAANKKGVSLETIVKTAGWSSAQTFKRFYHKQISTSVQDAIVC